MRKENHEQFYTHDHQLLELLSLSETVAKSKAAVLIQGGSGCGKRSLAQFIYQNSQRAHQGIFTFQAAQIALGNQELEFQRILTEAKGGTCLIIEVSQMSSLIQSKLFQIMSEGSDIRFIATTSKNISELVKQGEFREDLFYRLSVVNLKIPRLADRLGDVEYLAREFVKKWANVHGKANMSFSSDAIQVLNGYSWPGNVRELETTIERAVLISNQSEIRGRDIQLNSVAGAQAGPHANMALAWKPGSTLDQIERNVILEALKHHDGNRTHTAKALGISIRTLRNKLAEYRVMGIHA